MPSAREPLHERRDGHAARVGPESFSRDTSPPMRPGEPCDPFCTIDGKRWYVTGDLASIDPDGFVHFRGRLKRFIKAGGEMISLPAIEEPLARRYPPGRRGPARGGRGHRAPRRRPPHRAVHHRAAHRSARQTRCWRRRACAASCESTRCGSSTNMPVLGTGKTDYKVLRAMIETACHAETIIQLRTDSLQETKRQNQSTKKR